MLLRDLHPAAYQKDKTKIKRTLGESREARWTFYLSRKFPEGSMYTLSLGE